MNLNHLTLLLWKMVPNILLLMNKLLEFDFNRIDFNNKMC